MPGDDNGLPPGGVESLAETVPGVARRHDVHAIAQTLNAPCPASRRCPSWPAPERAAGTGRRDDGQAGRDGATRSNPRTVMLRSRYRSPTG